MKKHIGNLEIKQDCELDFTEITGNLIVRGGVSVKLHALTSVGGYVHLYSNAKLEAKALTSVGGYVHLYSNAKLPALTSVGGNVHLYSNAKLEAKALTSVGGNVHLYSNAKLEAPLAKFNDESSRIAAIETKRRCALELRASFMANGFLFADGILAKLIKKVKSIKGTVAFKVQIVGKSEISYVVQRGDAFSHGKTIEQAIKDLRYKLSDRDTTRFKKWTLDTNVSADDAIQAYRAITGACEEGTKLFCESIEVPESLTVARAIELTKGKYRNEQFAEFFKK